MTHDETVGKRLRALRERNHLTQDELTEKANLGKGTVSLYELGKRTVDTFVMMQLCHALDVDPNELMGVKESSEAEKRKTVIEEIRKAINETLDKLV